MTLERVNSLKSTTSILDMDAFRKRFKFPNEEMARTIFNLIDIDKSGHIDDHEYEDFVEAIENSHSPEFFVDTFIHLLDNNADGIFTAKDLEDALHHHHVNDYVIRKLKRALGDEHEHSISTESLRKILLAEPVIVQLLEKCLKATFADHSIEHPAPPRVPRKRVRITWEISSITAGMVWIAFLAIAVGRYFHFRDEMGHVAQEIAVAKGAGMGILCVTCLLYITKLDLLVWDAPTFVRWLFSYTALHAHTGALFFLFAIVHTVCHFVETKEHSFSGSKLRTTITGIVMMVFCLAMCVTAFMRSRSPSAYRPFLLTHMLQITIVPIMIAHVPFRWYVLGPLLVLIAWNEFKKQRNTFSYNLSLSRRIGGGISMVTIPCGNVVHGPIAAPGAYYKVKIPALSWLEWHPFSLASSDVASNIEFLIKDLGNWTTDLGKLLDKADGKTQNLLLMVRGPYFAPAVHSLKYKNSMLVAAGIGVTPFLSICHRLVFHCVARQAEERRDKLCFHDKRLLPFPKPPRGLSLSSEPCFDVISPWKRALVMEPSVTLVWVVRDFQLVDYFLSYLVGLLRLQQGYGEPSVRVKIFFTGTGSVDLSTLVLNVFTALHYVRLSHEASNCLEFCVGRMDVEQQIVEIEPSAVFYCGSIGLGSKLGIACHHHKIPFYKEDFQNTSLSNWSEMALFKHIRQLFGKSSVQPSEKERQPQHTPHISPAGVLVKSRWRTSFKTAATPVGNNEILVHSPIVFSPVGGGGVDGGAGGALPHQNGSSASPIKSLVTAQNKWASNSAGSPLTTSSQTRGQNLHSVIRLGTVDEENITAQHNRKESKDSTNTSASTSDELTLLDDTMATSMDNSKLNQSDASVDEGGEVRISVV